MDKLRVSLIHQGYDIKLTGKESANARKIRTISRKNPSFLINDRGDRHYTHPYYPGPFTKQNIYWYHNYCSLEMWVTLGRDPREHWDYRGDDGWSSYNPSYNAPIANIGICLSITQRKCIWRYPELNTEIFDDLSPRYFFKKLIRNNSIKSMDKLRVFYIHQGFDIKLTKKESKTVGKIHTISYQNPSWLMKDRGNLHYTHPEYPGPFTKENVKNYHLYCSLEMWEVLEMSPQEHWDYRGDDGWYIYTFAEWSLCCEFLPITQRKNIWKYPAVGAELFDNLRPRYFFSKIDQK